jgi:ABC-2 type transport system permease protein
MWRRIFIIARREFLYTVKRREFLLVTFGLPIFYVFLMGIASVATGSAIRSAQTGRPQPKAIGFYDRTGKFDRATLGETRDGIAGKVFDSLEAGQKAVKDKEIRSLVEIPADFAKTGTLIVYAPARRGTVFSGGGNRNEGGSAYTGRLRRAALAGKTDADTITLVTRDTSATTRYYDAETGKFGPPNVFAEVGKLVVPYAFSFLLMMSVLMGSSYLVHGIAEEKENRVIEVLLSAASSEELLAGKIIGLGGASLLQLGIWLSGGLITVAVIAMNAPQAAALATGPGVVATAITMFLLGFCLYATLMAGIGSLGTSWKESQQMSGMAVMPLVMPLIMMPVFLETPNGPVAQFLSYFPFTAPIGMMLRIAAGGGSAWEVALSAVVLIITVVLSVKFAARLFRLSLLMYGQRPSTGLIMKHLFARAA